MNKVVVLVEGYARATDGGYGASPSSVLIYHNDLKILVDPGANASALLEGLKKEELAPKDIDILFLTHYHPDHFLNLKLFPDHDLYDGSIHWKNDEEFSYAGKIPGTEIEILQTPGHSPEHVSLLVNNTEQGIVCVAQDVFWWEDGKQKSDNVDDLMKLEDPFMTDWDALQASRELVLERADWIIPGHGKIFKNPNKN